MGDSSPKAEQREGQAPEGPCRAKSEAEGRGPRRPCGDESPRPNRLFRVEQRMMFPIPTALASGARRGLTAAGPPTRRAGADATETVRPFPSDTPSDTDSG